MLSIKTQKSQLKHNIMRLLCLFGDTMSHSLKYQYTNVSIEELQIMERIKLSGFYSRVYLAIKSFAFGDKKSSFPSYRTIAKALEMETTNFKVLISQAVRKLVSVGLIIKNEVKSTDRFIITSKSSHDNKVVKRRGLSKRLTPEVKQTLNLRNKNSNNLLYFSNETELTKNNIERFLFGLLDTRTLTWKPSEAETWANKWFKESSNKMKEVLIQTHKGKCIEDIITESITLLPLYRGYEPWKSQTSTPSNFKTKIE